MSLSENPTIRLFTLGQHQATFDVRLRTTVAGLNGDSPALHTADMVPAALCHVAYTRDAAGVARLYLDGVPRTTATVLGDFPTWEDGMPFALANELSYDRPWLGEFHLVAVYARDLAPAEVARNHRAGPGGKTP